MNQNDKKYGQNASFDVNHLCQMQDIYRLKKILELVMREGDSRELFTLLQHKKIYFTLSDSNDTFGLL